MSERAQPAVAVIMPVRNEAQGLERAVAAVLAQDEGRGIEGRGMELCLAVGPSDDGTEAIAAGLAERDHRVRVVDNPEGSTPAGLNRAIAATSAPIVVRVDGHAELSEGYVARALATLERTGAVNVGGIQRATGRTPFQRTVAAAMSSRFGVGDAKFHYGGTEGPTDTVYLGVFRRDALEAVGGYDERFIRNQDYELNWRLREAGGVIWFDPELVVTYQPRGTLGALARQYYEYGVFKAAMVRLHPRSLRWRQAVPPVAVAGMATGLLVAPRWRWGLVPLGSYLAAVAAAAGTLPAGLRLRALAVFPAMHLSWGIGFWRGWVDR